MKYLLDENLSPTFAQALRDAGFDCVSILEIGLAGASDAEVRRAAVDAERVLITLDGDFANLLRFPTAGTPGVIRMRIHPATLSATDLTLRWTLAKLADLDLSGKLVTVDGNKIRIRG